MKKNAMLFVSAMLLLGGCNQKNETSNVEKQSEQTQTSAVTQNTQPDSTAPAKNQPAEKEEEPVIEHEFVDLGLSVKWATCNLGAAKPAEFGDFYSWGETKPKQSYVWETYKWCEGKNMSKSDAPRDFTKYCTDAEYGVVDNKVVLEEIDDAATANWGKAWRMPTVDEANELIEGCKWKWTTNYEGSRVEGAIGTSKKNGNSIFFPKAGNIIKGVHYDESCDIWTSSLCQTFPDGGQYITIGQFDGGFGQGLGFDNRHAGRSVRAVLK